MSFITLNGNKVSVNGAAQNAPKTQVGGEIFTQLRGARSEESGFKWYGRKIEEVEISGVSVYDEVDVNCVAWFIEAGIKVDLSNSWIAPRIVDDLAKKLSDLSKKKIKVIEGSKINLPHMGGYSGLGKVAPLEEAAEKIGFKILSLL